MKEIAKKLSLTLIVALFLTACGKNWSVEVQLSPEETRKTNEDIKATQKEINDFNKNAGDIYLDKLIVKLARDYEKLGDLGKAIKLYENFLKNDNPNAPNIINNLGRLYEQVGEYDMAVAQYKRLVDEFFQSNYLYDITWTYIRAAQKTSGEKRLEYRKNAEKYFNAWQMDAHKTDEQTQQAIKQLRIDEKTANSKN